MKTGDQSTWCHNLIEFKTNHPKCISEQEITRNSKDYIDWFQTLEAALEEKC